MKSVSLYLRSFFFTLFHPGIVAGLIPYWILESDCLSVFQKSFSFFQYFGIVIFLTGLYGLIDCIIRFALEGNGTLSPLDPTHKIVLSGLYRYTRNPMYISVVFILIGESLFFKSKTLGIYTAGAFFVFNVFIILIEEPRMRRDFGIAYINYCKKVQRWF
jgi:protein-S-isoprenylcysteine O-methyltransferase Ste14